MESPQPVVEAIAEAFASARQPCTWQELASPSLDLPYVVRHFLGKAQDEVEQEFAGHENMEDFDSMTARAVEYYLPAVMRYMLREPDDSQSWIWIHGSLRCREGGDVRSSYRALTPSQYRAIALWADFLMWFWDSHPEMMVDPVDAMELAETYQTLADKA